MKKIAVIGSGVSGLTSALSIIRAGHQVFLFAREQWPETTSAVAAAFWYPYMANPRDKVMRWGAESFKVFGNLATEAGTGVKWWRFIDVTQDLGNPWWASVVKNFSAASKDELPVGVESGVAFESLIIDSSIYLPYLKRTIHEHGGEFVQREIKSFDDLLPEFDTVINCSGLGARGLTGDYDLKAARGQIVRIKRHPDDGAFLSLKDHTRFAHCIPRETDTILGGTYEESVESLEPSSNESAAIIFRCKEILPRLNDLSADDIIESRCGLRPIRSEIRLEKEERDPGKFIIHNYGHGGAGFSMSWGCAADVVRLVDAL